MIFNALLQRFHGFSFFQGSIVTGYSARGQTPISTSQYQPQPSNQVMNWPITVCCRLWYQPLICIETQTLLEPMSSLLKWMNRITIYSIYIIGTYGVFYPLHCLWNTSCFVTTEYCIAKQLRSTAEASYPKLCGFLWWHSDTILWIFFSML